MCAHCRLQAQPALLPAADRLALQALWPASAGGPMEAGLGGPPAAGTAALPQLPEGLLRLQNRHRAGLPPGEGAEGDTEEGKLQLAAYEMLWNRGVLCGCMCVHACVLCARIIGVHVVRRQRPVYGC